MKHGQLVRWIQCAIFAALLCIVSPISIKIGTIPLTLWMFGVMLCGVVLPWRQSLLSVVLFLLLSLCGLPVFSGGNSGLTALVGPTGGYIWAYLPLTPLISILCQKTILAKQPFLGALAACLASIPVCYLCATAHYSLLTGTSFSESIAVCAIPFILPDCMKAAAASLLGVTLRRPIERYLTENSNS